MEMVLHRALIRFKLVGIFIRSIMATSRPHFYTQWTRDGHEATGCFNMDCPGFIRANGATISPGDAIEPVSDVPHGHIQNITLRVLKSCAEGVAATSSVYRVFVLPLRRCIGEFSGVGVESVRCCAGAFRAAVLRWRGGVFFLGCGPTRAPSLFFLLVALVEEWPAVPGTASRPMFRNRSSVFVRLDGHFCGSQSL